MTSISADSRIAARLRLVDEHVRLENQHDLDGIMGTFGENARYHDQPWNAHYLDREQVRAFYADLLRALPDLKIEVRHRHPADEAIILELIVRGRHLSAWRGLPATGREIEFPLCAVFRFDANDRLASETIYYDRATVLRQLGVLHEPQSLLGQISTLLTHPLTMARVVTRKIWPQE